MRVACVGLVCALVASAALAKEPVVEHVGDVTRLPGLEQFVYGGTSELQDTVLASLVGVMAIRGEPVSYHEIQGLSGMAFRLLYQWPWTPAAPEPREGYDCTQVAAAALGLELVWHDVPQNNPAALAEARAKAVASLDAGWPVLLYERMCAVGVAYRDAGKVLFCRRPGASKPGYEPFAWPLWTYGLVSPAQTRPARRDAVRRALKLAVDLAEAPKHGDYVSGFAAYERWAADLNHEARFANQPAKALDGWLWVNGWCYGSLHNARASAERFLRAAAPEFDGPAAPALRRAADLYQQVHEALAPGDPFPWDLFPQDFRRKQKTWDQAVRAKQADNLVKAMNLEMDAIAQVKLALDALAKAGR